jgi:hypothetical protein
VAHGHETNSRERQSPVAIRAFFQLALPNRVLLPVFSHRSPAAWLQALKRSSSSFRSKAMQPPSPVLALRQKAAIGAVETMEEVMLIRALTELMRLSRTELFDLAALITTMLPHDASWVRTKRGFSQNFCALLCPFCAQELLEIFRIELRNSANPLSNKGFFR